MSGRKISFDGWVLDCESGDLSRDGNRHRLQELPLKVLDLLLASPGGVVTREQFINHLWPKGVVDFDTGLNTAVRKLRVALADVADSPRYIETIPRRGYRFVGTIDPDPTPVAEPVSVPFAAQPIDEATFGGEAQPVEAGQPFAPSLAIRDLAGGMAEVPDRSVDRSIPQEPGSVSRSRRRMLLGIVATVVAVGTGAIYWLSHRAAVPAAATASAPGLALQDKSVAVLPFESLSTEPNNEFLAQGIAQTVLHRLASLQDLTVISRTSSFAFKNRHEDTREIGRALNAHFLVEGSVQRAGDRLRVQAQLIDAASGKQLWSLAFDRPLADIFALQDEISSQVADHLSVSLTRGTLAPNAATTSNLDAYLSYLQGLAFISTRKITDAKLAVEYFASAAQLDPQFAAAYAQESRAITLLGSLRERGDEPEDMKRAIALNERALALDPLLGEAWVQRANLLLTASGDQDAVEAEKAYRKGLALAPNYGQGFEEFADFLALRRRLNDALIMIERARQVDPLLPRNHYLKAVLLDTSGKDSPEIESLYLQALKLNPTYHPALVRLGELYAWRGEYARGLMLTEKAVGIEPEAIWVRASTAANYLILGDVAAAQDVLGTEHGRDDGMRICVLSAQGDHHAAVRRAYELFGDRHPDTVTVVPLCAAAEILRDAVANRQFEPALHALESQYAFQAANAGETAFNAFIWGLPLTQLLLAKGETARGNRLAKSILAKAEKDPVYPDFTALHLLARAGALTLLGEKDLALDSLESSMNQGLHVLWWIIDQGMTFDRLKQDQRYKALAARMTEMARKQAEQVAKMRLAKELPQRPVSIASVN